MIFAKCDNIVSYARRVFVMDVYDDPLPELLNSVKGVADSEVLPLDTSRAGATCVLGDVSVCFDWPRRCHRCLQMTGAPREKRVFYLWSAFWVSEFRCAEFRYPEFRYPEEPAGRMKERLVFDEYAVEKKLVACKAEFDPLAS